MNRTVHKRLIAFTQSLEYKRGVEAAQQKAPGLATGGSAGSADEAEN
jgi:hypothetical protein